jgi:hypothetical protein
MDDWLIGSDELAKVPRNGGRNLPMERCDVVEVDLTMAGPSGWRDMVLRILIFSCWVRSEVLDPRYATNVRLKLRPESDEQLDTLRKENNIEKRDTDIAGAQLAPQCYHQDDKYGCNSGYNKVQNKCKPSLYCEEFLAFSSTKLCHPKARMVARPSSISLN